MNKREEREYRRALLQRIAESQPESVEKVKPIPRHKWPQWPTHGPIPAEPFPGQCLACTETTFRFGCRSRCPRCPAVLPSGAEEGPGRGISRDV